jgi:hypothetical protein
MGPGLGIHFPTMVCEPMHRDLEVKTHRADIDAGWWP